MNNQTKQELIEWIDRCIQERFFRYEGDSESIYHNNLCLVLGLSFVRSSWLDYWYKINNEHRALVTSYFNHDWLTEEAALLRLLIVEDFKQWIREL
jgi:hypothetical protein